MGWIFEASCERAGPEEGAQRACARIQPYAGAAMSRAYDGARKLFNERVKLKICAKQASGSGRSRSSSRKRGARACFFAYITKKQDEANSEQTKV